MWLIKKILIVIILCNFKHGLSQIYMVRFNYLESSLSKINQQRLDSLGVIFKQKESKIYNICLTNFACESELKEDKKIGATRAIEIIDYFEKNYGVFRERFIYIDSHTKRLKESDCHKEGSYRGITIKLVPN